MVKFETEDLTVNIHRLNVQIKGDDIQIIKGSRIHFYWCEFFNYICNQILILNFIIQT